MLRARGWILPLLLLAACEEAGSPDETSRADGGPTIETLPAPTPGLSFDSVALESYCESRAQVDCHRLEVCRPTQLRAQFSSPTECEQKLTELCHRSFAEESALLVVELGLVTFDPVRLATALTEHSRRHCNALASSPSLQAGIWGTRADGERCRSSDMCSSGFCSRQPFSSCGTCGSPDAGAPSSCPGTCPRGETCRCERFDGGQSCGCTHALEEGDSCGHWRTGCLEGLECHDVLTSSGEKTICRRIPNIGEPCGTSTGFNVCVGEGYCDRERDPGSCQRPQLVGASEPCNSTGRLCPAGYDCRSTCVPQAVLGESCVTNSSGAPDGGPPSCAEGQRPCRGTCLGPQDEGSFCTAVEDCRAPLTCFFWGMGGGSCSTWDTVRERISSDLSQCQ